MAAPNTPTSLAWNCNITGDTANLAHKILKLDFFLGVLGTVRPCL